MQFPAGGESGSGALVLNTEQSLLSENTYEELTNANDKIMYGGFNAGCFLSAN